MTSSERPSPEPLLKKEASPAVLGGREFWIHALEASNALNYRVWGIPAVLSRGIPGNALRAFSGVFPELFWNFFRKVREVLHGVGADGVGVKFPIFAVNCCCLPLSFRRRREKRRKAKKNEEKRKNA